jgi:uncharacterized protein YdaU (DUF1376 family)
MSTRPWMPLYVGDYLAKTAHLTAEQHGAYLLLLMHYWTHGSLPLENKQLMAIARQGPDSWASNCQILAQFFDNRWRNKRMDRELAKSKAISNKRAYAGLKGAWAKNRQLPDNVWQMPPQPQPHTKKEATEKK